MDKLKTHELNYILEEIPNKLNKSSFFKNKDLFAFGSGNTHLESASLIIISKNHEYMIKNANVREDLILKYKLKYIEQKYIKCEIILSVDRTALGILGNEYFFNINQNIINNHNKGYFFLLDENFGDRYSKSYSKNKKTVQNHSVNNLPNSISSNIINFLTFLILKNKSKLSIDEETELYELSGIGNPYGHLATKYLY